MSRARILPIPSLVFALISACVVPILDPPPCETGRGPEETEDTGTSSQGEPEVWWMDLEFGAAGRMLVEAEDESEGLVPIATLHLARLDWFVEPDDALHCAARFRFSGVFAPYAYPKTLHIRALYGLGDFDCALDMSAWGADLAETLNRRSWSADVEWPDDETYAFLKAGHGGDYPDIEPFLLAGHLYLDGTPPDGVENQSLWGWATNLTRGDLPTDSGVLVPADEVFATSSGNFFMYRLLSFRGYAPEVLTGG